MTYFQNPADGGANGVGVTIANSDDGSGNSLTLSANGTRTYSSTWANSAPTSFKVEGLSGVSSLLGFTGATTDGVSLRFYFRMPAWPGATCGIAQIRSSGDANRCNLQVTALGRLSVGGQGGWLTTMTTVMAVDTTYRIEARFIKGTTSGNGLAQVAIFAGESGSALETYSPDATIHTSTDQLQYFRFGKIDTIAHDWVAYFDDVAFDDGGGSALLGANTAVGSITRTNENQVEVDLTGSVGTLSVTQVSGTTATIDSTASPIIRITTPAHKDVLVFQVSADGSGDPVLETFKVFPTSLSNRLVYTGGGASDIANWD